MIFKSGYKNLFNSYHVYGEIKFVNIQTKSYKDHVCHVTPFYYKNT